jgi:hypothetical protein
MLHASQRSSKYQFYSHWLELTFDLTRLKPMIYNTQGEHANHYTTDAHQTNINTAIKQQ